MRWRKTRVRGDHADAFTEVTSHSIPSTLLSRAFSWLFPLFFWGLLKNRHEIAKIRDCFFELFDPASELVDVGRWPLLSPLAHAPLEHSPIDPNLRALGIVSANQARAIFGEERNKSA